MTRGRMQVERVVRLMAVEEHRDRDDGNVRQHQAHNHVAPPRKVKYPGKEHPLHVTPYQSRTASHASPRRTNGRRPAPWFGGPCSWPDSGAHCATTPAVAPCARSWRTSFGPWERPMQCLPPPDFDFHGFDVIRMPGVRGAQPQCFCLMVEELVQPVKRRATCHLEPGFLLRFSPQHLDLGDRLDHLIGCWNISCGNYPHAATPGHRISF